jgi:hypothetical protein
MREVTFKATPGGGISIQSPRWRTGGHGDLVSALVLSVWDAKRQAIPEVPERFPAEGSPEFYRLQVEQRRKRKEQRFEREREERFALYGDDADWWLD